MTIKRINELYDLAKGTIEVEANEDDDEILAIKRGDYRKATAVAMAVWMSMHPARIMIKNEIGESMAAVMAVLFEESDEFYDLLHDRLIPKEDKAKDEVIDILREALEALEGDRDE